MIHIMHVRNFHKYAGVIVQEFVARLVEVKRTTCFRRSRND